MQSNEIGKIISSRACGLGISVEELSVKLGFRSETIMRAIIEGGAKLSLDRVVALAEALELSMDALAIIALRQYFDDASISVLRLLLGSNCSEQERAWIDLVRSGSQGDVSPPSKVAKRLVPALVRAAEMEM